jgi:hypothetical protein
MFPLASGSEADHVLLLEHETKFHIHTDGKKMNNIVYLNLYNLCMEWRFSRADHSGRAPYGTKFLVLPKPSQSMDVFLRRMCVCSCPIYVAALLRADPPTSCL